jgi:hypothetical protein
MTAIRDFPLKKQSFPLKVGKSSENEFNKPLDILDKTDTHTKTILIRPSILEIFQSSEDPFSRRAVFLNTNNKNKVALFLATVSFWWLG